ncbi:MAG TPA: hypothetical protein VNH64_12855 [Parvularculaceae bacterium]|nr:hypothetical protein [Parvularculaceae bacterium]
MKPAIVNNALGAGRPSRLLAALACLALSPAPVSAQRPDQVEIIDSACRGGDMLACANLAVLYRHGRGVPMDYGRALKLSVEICERGVEFGCGYAGEMTFKGFGIAANPDAGAKLMRRACARGDQWSCQALVRHGLAPPPQRQSEN